MEKRKSMVTMALLIATFLSAIEVTIVSTAMPAIVDKLGGFELMSWVFAVYLLTSAIMTPIFGKLSDLFGRKIVFIVGTSLFVAGSVLCGFSQNMHQLIAFRALQGLGAGAVIPVTFTIIGDLFTFEQRAKVQGMLSSVWGIAGIFGPLVGGFFTDYLSWHWIFFINVPFGIVSIFIISVYFKENLEKKRRRIDYGGAITFAVGMTALLYVLLTGGHELPWSSPIILGFAGVAFLFLAVFVLIQMRHPEPMVPLKLFRIPDLAVSNTVSFTTSGILIGLTAYLPMWIQGVLLLGASSSGLTLTPMSIGWPLGAIVSGRIMTRIGTRTTSLIGLLFVCIGAAALSTIGMSTPNLALVFIMFTVGLGFGLSITVITVIVQSSVDWNMRGAATSANTFLRTLGQTLGIAFLGTLLNHRLGTSTANEAVPPDVLASGLHAVFVSLAVLAVISFAAAFRIPNRKAGGNLVS
ncbi:MDR family MFS transporter [Paenibacillus alkalitolerans]|uniref:MDR family MFS transporter n=1 Tax=Paenibacillus alkalitolerans TaxID=2799335 RepID=UPI0018F60B8C|nr:MDR family MFS transporter [Paenibacillus alkalitolerans]